MSRVDPYAPLGIVNSLTRRMADRYADVTGESVYLGRRRHGDHEFTGRLVVHGDGAAFEHMLRLCQVADIIVDDILAWGPNKR